MPFLSGTWPLCRIGRALGFGQVNLADKAVINLNVPVSYTHLALEDDDGRDAVHGAPDFRQAQQARFAVLVQLRSLIFRYGFFYLFLKAGKRRV